MFLVLSDGVTVQEFASYDDALTLYNKLKKEGQGIIVLSHVLLSSANLV